MGTALATPDPEDHPEDWNKPGRPAKYDEEWSRLERDSLMIRLRRQGMTHHEIAMEMGIARSTVSTNLKKLAEKILTEAGAVEVALVEASRLEEAEARFFNKKIAPPGEDDFTPQSRDIEIFLKLSESRRKLHGVDAPAKHEWHFDDGDMTQADHKAAVVERLSWLADKMVNAGIGSGRAPEGKVVGDDAEVDEDIIDVEVVEDEPTDS